MPGRVREHPAVTNVLLDNVPFIQTLSVDQLQQCYDGRTLIEWAVAHGCADVADYLLGLEIDAEGLWALAEHHGTLAALVAVFQVHGIVDDW